MLETPPRFRFLLLVAAGLAGVLAAPALWSEQPTPHAFTAHDLVTMARVSDPRASPDGRQVVYVLRETDLEADRGRTDLWLVPVDASAAPRRLTTHEAGDWSPRWARDGSGIYFLSSRSGSAQVWFLPLAAGEARRVSDLPLEVASFALSLDGAQLAVSLEVFTDCPDLACTTERLAARAASKVSGQHYDHLFIRHWDTWKDGRRAHLFVLASDPAADAVPVDVSRGLEADVPSKPFGGDEEYTFTPDGTSIVFSARVEPDSLEPRSTNFDLYQAPIDGSAAPHRITDNPAWDTQPTFSPDGKTLAYLAMTRPGFESDRFRIVLRAWPDGEPKTLTEGWDRSPGSMVFAPDGKQLYATAGNVGQVSLFAIDIDSATPRLVVSGGHLRNPQVLADGSLVFGRDDFDSPVDLYHRATDGVTHRLTDHNRGRLEDIAFGGFEPFSFPGWHGEAVHGWLVKPVDFDPAKRYPVAFLIHGGPQGSFGNDFHYRWNPQVYAGAGYAAVMIDFHGSTGYGQAFTDSITGDWGGKPLEDLQKGLAAVLERYSFLDGDRVCALGASYGGYMINYIAGAWPDRFRCLVNHDGLFDLRSMYYATEELWFPEWEMGGTPYDHAESYARFNPALGVAKWRTPMLVIHGGRDFRVPLSQGLATFTALQRRGIPSRMLYYPDENHWVRKPANSLDWHREVLAWLARWLHPQP